MLPNCQHPKMQPTFAELFCSQQGVAPGNFNRVVLRRSLYPHARLIARLVEGMEPDFFAADRDFVSAVGALRRARDYSAEVSEFIHHPDNRRPVRRHLKIRLSTSRLKLLFKASLEKAGIDVTLAAGTEAPFVEPPTPGHPSLAANLVREPDDRRTKAE